MVPGFSTTTRTRPLLISKLETIKHSENLEESINYNLLPLLDSLIQVLIYNVK